MIQILSEIVQPTILNLSTLQTIHVSVELSGCHFSGGGGSDGMTNLLVSTFDLFDNINLPFTIPDDPVIDALGDTESETYYM